MKLKNTLLILIPTILVSCKTDPEIIWVPDVYKADHKKQEIKAETGVPISCKMEAFSQMVCIGESDFTRLYKHCLKAD